MVACGIHNSPFVQLLCSSNFMFLLLLASMSVKEILQSLVDDGMVDTDRIGTSNYFWAFPSKALHARKRKLEELESQVNLFYEKYLFM